MVFFRFGIPSANLQSELQKKLHVMNAGSDCGVHVEGKLCVLELLNAVVLASKVLVDGSNSVIGGIKDGFDLDNTSSLKRGEASLYV